MAEYRDRYGELTSLGIALVAVSVDEPKRSRALIEQLNLPFTLLCDTKREVVRLYELFNEKEKGGIAYPATFVLDRDRTVRFQSLDRTRARVDLDELFRFLKRGITSAAPEKPLRKRLIPHPRDLVRVVGNAIRFGIRSPR